MTVFAEGSAVVKLYADEVGADEVRALTFPVYVSALARVAVSAALWKKHRTGELVADDVVVLAAQFAADFHDVPGNVRKFRSIAVTPQIISRAVDLLSRHNLRAYDAVQLATALTVRTLDPQTLFACFDSQLVSAGLAEGYDVLSEG